MLDHEARTADGPKRCVVLLSGGLDSATTLAHAIDAGFEAWALTVLYGQRHAVEIERARAIAAAAGAAGHRLVEVDLAFPGGSALTDRGVDVPRARSEEEIGEGIPATYVPARNTVFLSVALAWAETLGALDLFLGVNAIDYSGYPDCRPEYLRAFERMARLATRSGVEGGSIHVHAPLLHMMKGEIVQRAASLGVDLALTISCYDPGPDGRPCRTCDACILRARGFADAGIDDPGLC